MRKPKSFSAIFALAAATALAVVPLGAQPEYKSVKIGNYFVASPYGIAVIVDDETAFLIDPASDSQGQFQVVHERSRLRHARNDRP